MKVSLSCASRQWFLRTLTSCYPSPKEAFSRSFSFKKNFLSKVWSQVILLSCLAYTSPALAFFDTFNTKVGQLTTDLAVLIRALCVLWVVVEIALLVMGRGNFVRLLLPIAGSILLTILPAVKTYFGM